MTKVYPDSILLCKTTTVNNNTQKEQRNDKIDYRRNISEKEGEVMRRLTSGEKQEASHLDLNASLTVSIVDVRCIELLCV